MHVIAYTYEAAFHCVDCTTARHHANGFKCLPRGDADDETDEHGIPYCASDSEGNLIHPVFSTDEMSPRGEYCADCFEEIAEPYLPYGYEIFAHDDYDHDPEGEPLEPGFYWWACQPGCIPDGEPNGPFKSEEEALADVLEGYDW